MGHQPEGALSAGPHPRGLPGFVPDGEGFGRVRGSALQTILRVLGGLEGDLFVYVVGLLGTIGCLEGHSVKPVEVAAMREVCQAGGVGDSIGVLLRSPELSSCPNALKSPHSAVRAHATPKR